MASLVLGAVGAAVGFYLGGPFGASIGWSLGAMAGAEIERRPVYGPKLSDLKLQTSSYGQMIPITFGTIRVAGNVIWQTDLVEHEQKSGGKGGPTSINYTYTASFAILLCEGPIGGVRRIWADSRLVYDAGAASTNNFPFVLYLGSEEQYPDPTIEAIEGAGNVPAHRGTAYAVFSDIPLTDYGNRIPNMTFEVFSITGPIPWRVSTFTPFNNAERAGYAGTGPQNGAIENGALLLGHIADSDLNAVLSSRTFDYTINSYDFDGNLTGNVLTVMGDSPPGSTSTYLTVHSCINNPHVLWGLGGAGADPPDLERISAFYYDGVITVCPIRDPAGFASFYAVDSMLVFGNDAIYGTGGAPSSAGYVCKWDAPGGMISNGTPVAAADLPEGGSSWTTAVDDRGDVWCCCRKFVTPVHDQLFHFDRDLNLINSWAQDQTPAHLGNSGWFTVWNGYLYLNDSSPGSFGEAYSMAGGAFILTDPGIISEHIGNTISLGNGLVLVSDGLISLVGAPGGVPLGDIVSALSVRAGLSANQIDVTELPDIVDGYAIAQQTDCRAAIEPLMTAWPFDGVEHDVIMKFVRRKVGQHVTAIPDDDLGAYAWPGEPPSAMTTERAQEVELPRIVDAVFLNKDTDYQNGEQRAQRLITTSNLTATVQLPIVMDNAKARQICDVLLYNAWTERESFSLSLPRKWQHLEPSDVVNARNRLMRIVSKTEQADGVIRIKALATNLQVYEQATPPAPGVGMPGSGGTPPTGLPQQQLSNLILLDLPLLNDHDLTTGYYVAMAGASRPTWRGASLQKSSDGGANYSEVATATVPAIFGSAATALGAFGGGNTFDEINAVTVIIGPGGGELVSDSQAAVLNGANVGLLGSEVLQYRSAELVAASTYVLTGLLRGRKGTGWAMATHVIGERFVLLSTVINVAGITADMQRERQYKAVTYGGTLSGATVHPFTDTGVVLAPYAPVHLGQGINGAGDITLSWIRRTRIDGSWRDYVDVPLGESAERYQVTLWTDGTYRTPTNVSTATAPTVTFTSAQQTTIFGSPQALLYWSVAQIGALGPGYDTLGRAPVYATPPPASPPPATGVPPMGVQWHAGFNYGATLTNARNNFNYLMNTYGSSWAFSYMFVSTSQLSNDLGAQLGDGAEAARIINTFGGEGNFGPAGMLIPFGPRIDPGPTMHSFSPLVNIPLPHPDNDS